MGEIAMDLMYPVGVDERFFALVPSHSLPASKPSTTNRPAHPAQFAFKNLPPPPPTTIVIIIHRTALILNYTYTL
jgi:hypothetical protein